MGQPSDFGFGSEETMVRDAARKFLKDTLPVEKLRVLVAGDHEEAYESAVQPLAWDPEHWRRAVELGWTTLVVPESAQGAGMKWVTAAALAEEAGRAALPSPLLATLAATAVLRAAVDRDSQAANALLGRIAAGESASLAAVGPAGEAAFGPAAVTATGEGDTTRLSGAATLVQDARKAGFFVVAAREGDGVGIFAVDADTPGLTIDPDRIVDLTRDQATLRFQDVRIPASARVNGTADGLAVLTAAAPAIFTLVAADITGAAEWQLQTTAEYARVRKQFDRPIGFFQAVKHPIANVMIDLDRARSLVYAAACALDADPDEAPRLAHMAKAAASDLAAFASSRSVQLHGGIGFTWECDVHIWFKRQKHNQFLYGDAGWHRARLAELY